jgi:protein kinase C substrate 80K-H
MVNILITVLQGSKIRATYIAFAQKEKNRIEKLVVDLEREVASREPEVERLRGEGHHHMRGLYTDSLQDIAKHAESMSAAELERKKQSRGCFFSCSHLSIDTRHPSR